MIQASIKAKVSGGFLLVILLLSFGLRTWGIRFGLPEYTRYHPDEHALVERAAAILWTGDWNLHRFNYPPLYAYLQSMVYAIYFLWGASKGLWQAIMPFPLPQYYHVGRLLTACLGTLTVLLVYLIGRELYDRRTGFLAAAILGGCYLHVIHSHYVTFDVSLTFWISLTLLFSALMIKRSQPGWWFWAGLSAGLAGATKYNGAVVLIIPFLAHLLDTPWGEWGWANGRLVRMITGFLAGFLGGNPFALVSLPDFLNGLATVLHHYGTRQPGFEGTGNWQWYPRVFLSSADALWTCIGAIGLIGLSFRQWRKGLLLTVFPVVYYLMVARFVVRFERNMVPLLPFLALGAGWLLDTGTEWLSARLKRPDLAPRLAAVGLLLSIAPSSVAAVLFDFLLAQTDLREIAGNWVESHIAPGSKIAIEHYSIPFDYDRYDVTDVIRITDHNLAWYQQEGYDFLIISDGVWELLRRQPQVHADIVAIYNELTSRSRLVAEFVPHPPGLVVAGYPTIGVYHFAPVRIYQVIKGGCDAQVLAP